MRAVVVSRSAQSIGCTIEGKHPHDIIEEIDSGERTVPDFDPPREVNA